VLTPEKGLSRKNWQVAFNKISAKHFDYVLCTKDTVKVVAVIELDDKSHAESRTKQRDALIEAACKTAEVPLIRFKAQRNYQASLILNEINCVIAKHHNLQTII